MLGLVCVCFLHSSPQPPPPRHPQDSAHPEALCGNCGTQRGAGGLRGGQEEVLHELGAPGIIFCESIPVAPPPPFPGIPPPPMEGSGWGRRLELPMRHEKGRRPSASGVMEPTCARFRITEGDL